jgi:hypothetical protein
MLPVFSAMIDVIANSMLMTRNIHVASTVNEDCEVHANQAHHFRPMAANNIT